MMHTADDAELQRALSRCRMPWRRGLTTRCGVLLTLRCSLREDPKILQIQTELAALRTDVSNACSLGSQLSSEAQATRKELAAIQSQLEAAQGIAEAQACRGGASEGQGGLPRAHISASASLADGRNQANQQRDEQNQGLPTAHISASALLADGTGSAHLSRNWP